MIGWLQLTDEQRKTSLEQASIARGIQIKAIEKDWWVTLSLKALFQTPYAQYVVFKGGTSLSKCWKLIERFSEDIDIVLDPQAFNMRYEVNPGRSYLDKLKREGCAFTSTALKNALEAELSALGVPPGLLTVEAAPVREDIPDTDPQTILVKYPSLCDLNPYLADVVKIEVSVRSLKEPFSDVHIQSILSEMYPQRAYAETPFPVAAVEPKKTFLEKIFLLHEEFQRPDLGKIKTERMSRHFYDLEKLMDTEAGKAALEDEDLYVTIIHHRQRYSRLSWMDYNTLHKHTISFLPPEILKEAYMKDYAVMQEQMIYGESLEYPGLYERLEQLIKRFRGEN